MRGESEAAGMRQALTVEHEKVRAPLELCEGGQQGRTLAETQQPRHVRKNELRLGGCLFNDLQAWNLDQHYRRKASVAFFLVSGVGAGDEARCAWPAANREPRSHPALERDRLGGREPPSMTSDWMQAASMHRTCLQGIVWTAQRPL